jgi:hypothetical protein
MKRISFDEAIKSTQVKTLSLSKEEVERILNGELEIFEGRCKTQEGSEIIDKLEAYLEKLK